jgi:L-amino acid N-acyltransferase YncA
MSVTSRPARLSDAPGIAAIYAPHCESTATSFEVVAPAAQEFETRINTVTVQWPWLVLDVDGVVAGYAYAARHHERAAYRWAVNTGVYIAETSRRTGVGRALYTTLFELLRQQGYFKACAGITLPNAASVGLHEALGFSLVGVYRGIGYKLGAWHDVAWYEAELQPQVSRPPEPKSISTIDATAWRNAVAQGLACLRTRPA